MKFRKRITLNILVVLGLLTSVSAQTDSMVEIGSLEEAWKLARASNPDLKSYQIAVEKSERDVQASKAYLYPTVYGTVTGQKNLELATTFLPGEVFGQPGTTIEAQFGQEYAYNAGLNISYNLLDWQASLKKKIALLSKESAEVQQERYEQLLDQQVGLNYYTILIASRANSLNKQNQSLADSMVLLSRHRLEQGAADALSFNQAKINAIMTRQNLISSRELLNHAKNELRLLLGLGMKDTLRVTEQVDYSLPPLYNLQQLSTSMEVQLSSLTVQQSQSNVNLQKSKFVPRLNLNSYLGKQQFRDDFRIDFGDNAWSNYSFIGLNLTIPIFTGFSNRHSFNSSQLELSRAENEREKIQNESEVRDAELIANYQRSLDNANLAKEAFLIYKETLSLTFQKYEEGLLSLDRYQSVFEDYLDAENAFLNAMLATYGYYSQIIPRIR